MSSTSITLPPSLINLSNLLLTQNQMTDSNNLSAEKMLQLLATNRKHEQHAYSPGQLNNPFFGLLMDAQQQVSDKSFLQDSFKALHFIFDKDER